MTKPFRGTIALDERDSIAGLDAVHAAGGARRRAQRRVHRPRRRGLLGDGALGRPDRDAQHQPAGRARPDLHELAHDRAVLADPLVAAHRPQPHHERHGVHRRGHHGLPQRQRPHPVRVRHHRRGAGRARLEHLHARQVAPRRRRRDEPGLDQAELAHRPGLRALLRLPRRRDQPVVSRPGLRQPPRRAAVDSRRGLPPHDRPHRQGDRVHQGLQGHRARQAVLHVLLPGRHPRAPPRAEGVDRQVPGQVRHGLRALPRAGVRPPEGDGDLPRRRRAVAAQPVRRGDQRRRQAVEPGRRRAPVGRRCPRTSSGCSPAWPRSTPGSSATPTTRSVGCSTSSSSRASARTRSSCSCRTTAPAARAAPTGRSTRTSSSTASPTTSRRTCATSTSSARRPRTTTTRSGGRGRSTRRSRCGSATTSRAAWPIRC